MITQEEIRALANHCDVWLEPDFVCGEDRAGNGCLAIHLYKQRKKDFRIGCDISDEWYDLVALLGSAWVDHPKEETKKRLLALL